MKHLFSNDDDEIVAADTAEQARDYYEKQAGETYPDDEWTQLPDDQIVPIHNCVDVDNPEKKTAAQWASEHTVPMQVSTTYW